MVTEYLESGRAMDKAFVDRYIQTYETRFPEFLVDLEHVLGSRYVLADDPRVRDLRAEVPHRADTTPGTWNLGERHFRHGKG